MRAFVTDLFCLIPFIHIKTSMFSLPLYTYIQLVHRLGCGPVDPRFVSPEEQDITLFSTTVQTSSGADPASYSVATGIFSRE
jgi:hypothetical protein